MVVNGYQWFSMVTSNSQLLLVFLIGLQRFSMVSMQWFSLVARSSQWFSVVTMQLFSMVLNGSQYVWLLVPLHGYH